MTKYLVIGFAGFLGALARYALGGYVADRIGSAFPVGTLAINLTGSLALGFLATIGLERALLPPLMRTALTVGFVGAYTTFSTWSYETLRLIEDGSYALAALNGIGSALLGLLAVWVGAVLGRAL